MLDIKTIISNPKDVSRGLDIRGIEYADNVVADIISLFDNRKEAKKKFDDISSKINSLSEKIGQLIKSGDKSDIQPIKDQVAGLKDKSTELASECNTFSEKLNDLLFSLPNIPDTSVPIGNGDDEDEIISEGDINAYEEKELLPHWDLAKKFDLIDFDLGNKITGSGFPVYKKGLAALQRSLITYCINEAVKKGYEEHQVPIIVNENSVFGTGQIPDKENMMYKLADENYYLIPTGEVPLTNMYRDTIINLSDIPIKIVGHTPCFRREAGSWGSHVRGLNRLHQFDKIEIVQITSPDISDHTLENMVSYVEYLVKSLNLPFRRRKLCSGNLGFASSITYDIEVYSAGQKKWLEVSSISNFKSFQSNRLKLRYRQKDNTKSLPHTLNGSALALPRIVASLLENNFDGEKIMIPKVLQSYIGQEFIS